MNAVDPVVEEWMLQYRYFFTMMNGAASEIKAGLIEPALQVRNAEEALVVFKKDMDTVLSRIEKTYLLKIEPKLFDRQVELLKEGRYDSLIELALYSENVLNQRLCRVSIEEGIKVLGPD